MQGRFELVGGRTSGKLVPLFHICTTIAGMVQGSDKSVLSEGESIEATEGNQQVNKPVSKEEIEHLSAYADFINTLNLDDLDKRKS